MIRQTCQVCSSSVSERRFLDEGFLAEQLGFGRFQRSLQWGRGYSAAESIKSSRGTLKDDTLQWGRGRLTAELASQLPS
ncbi:MAG: hypothetical protein NTY19_07005 [Planctomycetota bacterium]|nr:hypothetical protein [Planctomycetota bacterium]